MSLNLNLRSQLGRKLTINELDDNFSNIENAINSGSSSQNEVKAHSSLTTDDIGKFVMSYTDPSWTEWVINGGTISGFTGSISEARVVFLTPGENDLDYLEYPVIGVLEDLSDGMAYISPMPEIIEAYPTTGIYPGTQSDIITSLLVDINNLETSVFNIWLISGGDDLVNLGKIIDGGDIVFSYIINSPAYNPITTGMVGDKILFKKTIPFGGGGI